MVPASASTNHHFSKKKFSLRENLRLLEVKVLILFLLSVDHSVADLRVAVAVAAPAPVRRTHAAPTPVRRWP